MHVPTDDITVLHVDDEPDLAELTAEFLHRESDRIDVETATDAVEGLAYLADNDVDCVVSDYDMPGMSGLEFLREVRADSDVPFILFTGKGSEEVASDAISAGVTDYLQKEPGTDQYAVLANRIQNVADAYHSRHALEQSQKRLSLFFEQSPLGVIEWDASFDLVRMNEAAESILGFDQADLEGESWERIVPEGDTEPVRSVVTQLLSDAGGYHSINENVTGDGEVITCEWHNRVVTDEDDEVLAVFSQFQDITDRREQQRELCETTNRLESIVEASPLPNVAIDPDGVVELWNDAAEEVFGWTAEEVVGGPLPIVPDDRGDEFARLTERVLDGEQFHDRRLERRTRSGEPIQVRLSAAPIRDADETVIGIMAVFNEVPEHERILGELHVATREMTSAVSRAEICERVVAAAAEIMQMPIAACWLYDDDADALVPVAASERSSELIADLPEYRPGNSLSWAAYREGETRRYDDVSTRSGRYADDTVVRSELIVPLGEFGVVNIGSRRAGVFDDEDVSLAKLLAANAEAALRRADREKRHLAESQFVEQALDAVDDVFYALDADGDLTRWNDSLPEATGYTDAEIRAMDPLELIAPDDRDRAKDAARTVRETGSARAELSLSTREGRPLSFELKGSRLTDADGEAVGMVWCGRQITDRE